MRGVPSTVTSIRKKVFTEVARLAYEGGDYTRMEKLPYVIAPGEIAAHRESIFLERAIAGERVRLAMGLPLRSVQEHSMLSDGVEESAIAEKYYADHGVPMMKTTQRFYRKYFGLCCEWYLEQKKLNWAADFQFALFPYLVNGIKNHLEDAYFRDMSGCELAEIEQTAGQKCQPIGHIGYYYPAEVWISEYGKLYAKYEYQDEIECFPDVFALIERDLRQCKFDSAAMKTVEALDGKL